MNTKNNQRSQNTKQQINEVFIRLLAKKRISNITINEICTCSGINRSTFYRHYTDIYSLFDQMQSEMRNMAYHACLKPVEDGYRSFSKICFQSLFQHILDYRTYYSILLNHQENCEIVDILVSGTDHGMDIQPLIQVVKLESGDEEIFRSVYFKGGLNAIIRHWISTGYRIIPEQLAYFMEKEYQYEVAQIEYKSVFKENYK